MATLVNDAFLEAGTNSVALNDHVGSVGGIWAPKPEYDGTVRVLGGSTQFLYSNPLDAREALMVASGGPTGDSWQLTVAFIAAGGVGGAGEILSKGSVTITASGVGAVGTAVIVTPGTAGIAGYTIAVNDGTSTSPNIGSALASSSATTDAAALAASINLNTAATGCTATSSSGSVIVTFLGGTWPNGWTIAITTNNGSGSFTPGTLSGGTNGSFSTATVNGVNAIPSGVTLAATGITAANFVNHAFTTDYAAQLAAAINAQASSPEYTASSALNVATIVAAPGTAAGPNGFVVASSVTNVTRSHGNMAGGNYLTPDNRLALCWSVQPNKKSFYRLREVGTSSALWAIERIDNGIITQLATSAAPSLPNGANLTVTLLYNGGKMTASFVSLAVVGAPVTTSFAYTDASPLPAGYFGVWGSGGGTTSGSFPNQVPAKGIFLIGTPQNFTSGTSDAAVTLPSNTLAVTGAVTGAAVFSPTSGGAVGGGTAAVTAVSNVVPAGGAIAGGSAAISSVLIAIYAAANDNLPAGGAVAGGAALVQDVIPYKPQGGAVGGGSAVVQDVIPFNPAGGAVGGGPGTFSFSYAIPTSGGAVGGGSGSFKSVSVASPAGGAVAGGAATVADRQAYYAGTGGGIAGGTAASYLMPAGFVPTAANPNGDPFPGWAINFETGAPSRYLGLPANSFALLNGVAYVANAGGIYALDAKNDAGAPIRARVMLPESDHGSEFNKRVPDVWIAGEMADAMVMQLTTDNADVSYFTVTPPDGAMRASRVEPGKGIEGRFLRVGFANVAGADFTLESVLMNLSILKRHGR